MPIEEGVPQHFALPFAFENGAAVTVDEDSPKEITDGIVNLLHTELGWLEWLPRFGRPDWTFSLVDPAMVHDLVLQWDNRATPELTQEALDRFLLTEVTQNA